MDKLYVNFCEITCSKVYIKISSMYVKKRFLTNVQYNFL